MSTTHTLPAGTIDANAKPDTKPTAVKASMLDVLNFAVPSIRRGILNAFMASLSIMLVNSCRQHVRWEQRKTDGGHIDAYNDLKASEDAAKVDQYWTEISGGKVDMPAIEVAQRLGFLRGHVLDLQKDVETSNWEPRPVGESVDFLLSMMKTEIDVTSPAVKAIAAATKKDERIVANMMIAAEASDRDVLMRDRDEIISLAESLCWSPAYGDDEHYTSSMVNAVNTLPPITQVNLMVMACNAVVSAYNAAFRRVIRGRAEFISDMTIAEDLWKRATAELSGMVDKFAADIDAFEDRGGKIKELKRIA